MENFTPPTQAELDAWKKRNFFASEHGLIFDCLITEVERLTKEVEKFRKDKERLEAIGLLWSATFQKYESWKANGVMGVSIKQVLADYRKCDAMQQKGEE